MKRIKMMLLTLSVAVAVSGAFATQPEPGCEYHEQFYKWGPYYIDAGIWGYNYVCFDLPGICTFSRRFSGEEYYACRIGVYFPIFYGVDTPADSLAGQ